MDPSRNTDCGTLTGSVGRGITKSQTMEKPKKGRRRKVVLAVPDATVSAASAAPAAQAKRTAEISVSKPVSQVAIDWTLRRKIHRDKVQARRPAAATTTAKNAIPARPAQHLNPILEPRFSFRTSLFRAPVAACVAAGVAACAAAAAVFAEPGGSHAKAAAPEPLGGLAPGNSQPTTSVPVVAPKPTARERGLNTYPEFVRKYVTVQK